ncbi:MAG: FAD-binding oxidoreductase [Polynucleobacter sp.]|nr:FAD-binding oxidoreductase [Polynucleobacter sp.]
MSTPVSSWGRLGANLHHLKPMYDAQVLPAVRTGKGLAFGNGRSYGDVCLNPAGVLWTTQGLDRFMEFDDAAGVITCESGILLRDIQGLVLARGWMLPVTPGTQLITLGGAIANDVHGKNHHVMGSFGEHVQSLRLLRTDGEVIECGPSKQASWFQATVGGMGLTGVITQATVRLRRVHGPWIETENELHRDLSSFFDLADTSEPDWEHNVSWVDCLNGKGRGVFMRGNHANTKTGPMPAKDGLGIPFVPPFSLVNPMSLRPFNWVYYQMQARKRGTTLVHFETFFHPLDKIKNWNRIYGPKGFYQYQSVVPRSAGKEALPAMLNTISRSGEGSFLAVLKTFGNRQSIGMMSFPMPGVTLALDFPNKGAKTVALLRSLDDIVRSAGGRIYAAKDASMPRDLFEQGYPRLKEFIQYRDSGISSAMSRRLMGN